MKDLLYWLFVGFLFVMYLIRGGSFLLSLVAIATISYLHLQEQEKLSNRIDKLEKTNKRRKRP